MHWLRFNNCTGQTDLLTDKAQVANIASNHTWIQSQIISVLQKSKVNIYIENWLWEEQSSNVLAR